MFGSLRVRVWWRWVMLSSWWNQRGMRRAWRERQARFDAAVARGEAYVGEQRDVHRLVREAAGDDGIRAVIRTSALKGREYQLLWGLSLAWVPHLTGSGTSLHRTAKSARLDLYEEGQHHDAKLESEFGGAGEMIYIPADIEQTWRRGFERANELFGRAVDAEAVLAIAEEQMEDGWAMTVHMPGPVYVATFTLAQLGREAEARAMLDRQLQKWYLHPDAPQVRERAGEKMERALERTLKA